MDRRPERKAKRAREEDADAAPDFPFEEAAAAGAEGDDAGEASRRPPGVFRFPWQKCRGGLGVSSHGAGAGTGAGWEPRDVFFRSLVDGGAAAIGVPGDRLVSPPPSKRALLDGVDAWLAAAAEGEGGPGLAVRPHVPPRAGLVGRVRMDGGGGQDGRADPPLAHAPGV